MAAGSHVLPANPPHSFDPIDPAHHYFKINFTYPKGLDLPRADLQPRSIEEVLSESESPKSLQSETFFLEDESSSSELPEPAWIRKMTMDDYTASLLQEIGHSPSQPSSLPPLLMINFLRQCFHPNLTLVDFPQSLVGLDYLEELENRRKRCVATALSRLGVNRATLLSDADHLTKKHASFAAWVRGLESNERKAEALYTQLYIALRRWILLNEFCLVPFHKYNCMAMLNLLFPSPSDKSPCTPTTAYLTVAVLREQREMYLKQIDAIKNKGLTIVRKLMEQGKRKGEETGWPAVRETLNNYLKLAGRLINEAQSIDDFGALDEEHGRPNSSDEKKKRKTTDSGVSFGTSGRHRSSAENSFSAGDPNKPLPITPSDKSSKSQGARKESTERTTKYCPRLEKITSELRKFRIHHKASSSVDTDIEVSRTESRPGSADDSGDALDKTRTSSQPLTSSSDLSKRSSPSDEATDGSRDGSWFMMHDQNRPGSRGRSKGRRKPSKAQEEADAFNRDEMMRQRAIWEARNG